MATIQEVDIKAVLARLRPNSAYHWKVDRDRGVTLAEALGEWRDANTQPPTEPEILTEWDVYLGEQAAETNRLAAVEQDFNDVRQAQIQAALDSIQADLATLSGSPNNATVLQIIGRILQRQSRIIKALRHLV